MSDHRDYTPPSNIWEVNRQLQRDAPLAYDDPRWVDTAKARGEISFTELYRQLGVAVGDRDRPETWRLAAAPDVAYHLFCGHVGSGKSTELRRITHRLDRPNLFLVVTLDAGAELDPHNLQYQDVLLALARNLLADLAEQGIEIDADHWRQLAGWFDERIEQHEETRSYAAELRAGAQAKSGLPLLASLFAGVTAAIRTNATHKETLRRIVRNHYADFASAFNDLIRAAEDACHEAGLGARILFIVDGTDKQRGEDAEAFFVRDVHQLKAIDGIFLYSTPIRMLHAYGALNQHFTGVFKLPMIKLVEKDGARHEAGWAAMRELLYRRAPQSLFERADVADHLIAHSGGHPRDLLRLLSIAFSKATGEHFDMPGAKGAVAEVAAGYRRLLEADDYPLLAAIDAQPDDEHNMKRVRELLDQLVILEYNAYWWRTHPAVQTLPAYRKQVETHDG